MMNGANLNTKHGNKSHIKTYIVLEKAANLIKIGKSKNVAKRLSSLQTSNPLELELIHVFDCDIELVLHKRFCSKNVRGEWFDLSIADIMGFVETLNTVDYIVEKPKYHANNDQTELLGTMTDLIVASHTKNNLKTIDDNGYDLLWIDSEERYSDNGQTYFERDIFKLDYIRVEYEMIYMIVFGKTESSLRLTLNVNDYDDLGPSIPKGHFSAMRDLQRANTVYIEDGLDFQDRKTKLADLFNRKYKQKLIDEIHLLNA